MAKKPPMKGKGAKPERKGWPPPKSDSKKGKGRKHK